MCNRLFFMIAMVFFCGSVYAAQVEIEINGVEKEGGFIMIGMSKDADQFEEKTPYFMWYKVDAVKPKTVARFEVDAGSYAISMYHDANSNEKLDTGAFGKPKERYGISNNKYGAMGTRPAFKEALLTIRDGAVNKFVINLR